MYFLFWYYNNTYYFLNIFYLTMALFYVKIYLSNTHYLILDFFNPLLLFFCSISNILNINVGLINIFILIVYVHDYHCLIMKKDLLHYLFLCWNYSEFRNILLFIFIICYCFYEYVIRFLYPLFFILI